MITKPLPWFLLVSILIGPLAWSQSRVIRPATSDSNSSTRHALVIGNSEYEYAGRLRNPLNDARAIDSTLQELDFEVTTLTNANRHQIVRSIQ